MNNKNLITTVNYHFWKPCNMRCKFCFATFHDVTKNQLPKGHLSEEESLSLIRELPKIGIEKINFVGGEPTLCPWLPTLVKFAKKLGLQTSVVTNGYKFMEDIHYLNQFENHLDMIGISIDSVLDAINLENGRAVNNNVLTEEQYLAICEQITQRGMYLKINTVVSSNNYREDLSHFILKANPKRWKILQMLPVKGQNDAFSEAMQISSDQFEFFCQQNSRHSFKDHMIIENKEALTDSYLMINPAGEFFDNTQGFLKRSESILKLGIEKALQQIDCSYEKFTARGGLY